MTFDFNDIVFSESKLSFARINQKFVDKIFQHVAKNRISSKRVIRQLRFDNNILVTRYQ